MSQSLAAVYVHFVFSTKDRAPILIPEIRPRMFEFIGGLLRHRDCVLLSANGVLDHVHPLVSLDRKWSLANLMRDVKANSSGWIKDEFPTTSALIDFTWQRGYGAFSIAYPQVNSLSQYIANQEEHHRGLSFQDEVRKLFREHNVEFDERYLWD